jgi:photosystem II stability/assembly factor-like uncharacterized protein
MRLLVGTVGQSVVMSPDDGQRWLRQGPRQGMHSDAMVRTLVNHPTEPATVLAGTDRGIYRSTDGGETWQPARDGPLSGYTVWSIAFHPRDSKVLFAGTGIPGAKVFRSRDGGATWQDLKVDVVEECDNVGIPRVTGIAIDPTDPRHVWASIEVDGVRHSADGGETWTRVDPAAIPNPDGHGVVVAPGPPKTVFVVVNNEIYASQDDGGTWQPVGARERFAPYRHVRAMMVDPFDPCAAWVTVGDATPGETGALMRTRDLGRSWQAVTMPVEPNSSMWVVHAQPDSRDLLMAASRYGYLYRSHDGGKSWEKLRRELSEVASITWVPT